MLSYRQSRRASLPCILPEGFFPYFLVAVLRVTEGNFGASDARPADIPQGDKWPIFPDLGIDRRALERLRLSAAGGEFLLACGACGRTRIFAFVGACLSEPCAHDPRHGLNDARRGSAVPAGSAFKGPSPACGSNRESHEFGS